MFVVIALSAVSLPLGAVRGEFVQSRGTGQYTPSPVNGKAMFDLYCTPCHGKEGKGDGPAATALKKQPSDLTRVSARNNGTFPTDKIRRYIEGREAVAGHGSREMPIWGVLFASRSMPGAPGRTETQVQEKIETIISYVQSIQAQ